MQKNLSSRDVEVETRYYNTFLFINGIFAQSKDLSALQHPLNVVLFPITCQSHWLFKLDRWFFFVV